MAKRGRRRKAGQREPNGRLQRPCPVAEATEAPPADRAEKAILDETLLQRGAVRLSDGKLGGTVEAMQREAGHVIGRLMLSGVITPRQYNAAVKLERVWKRWASSAGVPPHVITERARGQSQDPTEDEWVKAKITYLGAIGALKACSMPWEIFRFVEVLVMDDSLPPGLIGREWPPFVVTQLRAALDRLSEHFGLPANF